MKKPYQPLPNDVKARLEIIINSPDERLSELGIAVRDEITNLREELQSCRDAIDMLESQHET